MAGSTSERHPFVPKSRRADHVDTSLVAGIQQHTRRRGVSSTARGGTALSETCRSRGFTARIQNFRRARKNRDALGKEGLAHMRRISESLSWQQGQLRRTPPPVEIAESSRDVEKLPRLGM